MAQATRWLAAEDACKVNRERKWWANKFAEEGAARCEVSRSRLGTVRSGTGGGGKTGDGQRFDVDELGDEAISDVM